MNKNKLTSPVGDVQCLDSHGRRYTFPADRYIDRIAIYGLHLTNSSILMVLDSQSKKWEFPGGGLEINETEEDCLSREFQEETGLIPVTKGMQFLYSYISHFYDTCSSSPWRTVRKFYIISEVSGTTLKDGNGTDTAKVDYLPIERINRVIMSKEVRHVIDLACLKLSVS